jgi:hypothetical protein
MKEPAPSITFEHKAGFWVHVSGKVHIMTGRALCEKCRLYQGAELFATLAACMKEKARGMEE